MCPVFRFNHIEVPVRKSLSRRCDLCTRSVFVLTAVVFSLWLQHEPSIGLEGTTGASTGTLTGDDEGVRFFTIYGVSVLYSGRASENVRICARVLDVKHTGVYACKYTGMYFF